MRITYHGVILGFEDNKIKIKILAMTSTVNTRFFPIQQAVPLRVTGRRMLDIYDIV